MTDTEELNVNTTKTKVPDLASWSDDELARYVTLCGAELNRRESARKREALDQIKALARKHGLVVDVKGPAQRRGRQPSTEGRSDETAGQNAGE